MTTREKGLAWIAGGGAIVFVLVIAVGRLVIQPMEDADQKTGDLRARLSKLEQLEIKANVSLRQLKATAKRTYPGTSHQASSRVGERLTAQLLTAGLDESLFTRLPMGGRKLRGAEEIGWSVQGTGPLERIIDFLFLLDDDSYLHRLENLVITPKKTLGRVAVNFRYLTLIFDPQPRVQRPLLDPQLGLENEARQAYASIGRRDLFRPYIKRPPAPPPKPEPARAPPPSPPPGPGPETFKVVSLSQWKGKSEVLVLDLTHNKTRTYRPGDTLAGGVVLAVDYRALPSPKKPDLESPSRVIIANGEEYWAVESGDTLADKYRLGPDRLPSTLKEVDGVSRRDGEVERRDDEK